MVPILEYGSEVWAPYLNPDQDKWDATPIERVHTQFLKRLLGVNRSTTNILARAELGRHSLQSSILSRNINYIKYVEKENNHSLVKQAFLYEDQHKDERNTIFTLARKHKLGLKRHLNENEEINTISNSKLSISRI